MEFGEKLKRAREKKGLTQQSLADKIYVTRQAVSRWENGARYPDLLTTKILSDILEVSVDELLSGDELKNYSEKQPIIENRKSNLIMSGLFSALIVLLLIFLTKTISVFVLMIYNKEYEAFTTLVGVRDIIFNVLMFAVCCYVFVRIIKHEYTPKMVGITASLFFLLSGINRSFNPFIAYFFNREYMSFSFTVFIAPLFLTVIDLVFALFIYFYFTGEKNSLHKPVCIFGFVSVIFRLTDVVLNITKIVQSGFINEAYIVMRDSFTELLVLSVIAVIIICQSVILNRKRRLNK